MSDSNTNRRDPYSEKFKKFIVSGWAPYSDELPAELPSAPWAAKRREAIVEQSPGATLVFPAGPLKVRANDTDYRFRPHTAFAYYTGLGEDREPDAALVVSESESVLFFRPRAPRTDREFYADARYGEMWVGQRDSLEEMSSATGLECRDVRSLEEYLAGRDNLRIVREADPAVTELVDRVRGGVDEDADAELLRLASSQRFTKDQYEIDEMGRAVAATKVGFDAVIRELPNAVENGRGERWVEGIFALHARHPRQYAPLDRQRRRPRRRRSPPARRGRRGELALHRRRHPHPARGRHVHAGTTSGLRRRAARSAGRHRRLRGGATLEGSARRVDPGRG